jgi:hypothetical protein
MKPAPPNRRPSPALVISIIALAVACTGTAVAIPGSDRVGAGDIRAGAVRSSEVENRSLRGLDVRLQTIGTAQLADRAVTNPKLADDAVETATVADDSLTGADISESTLSVGQAFGAYHRPNIELPASGAYVRVLDLPLPPGYYLLIGKLVVVPEKSGAVSHALCELRAGGNLLDNSSWYQLANRPAHATTVLTSLYTSPDASSIASIDCGRGTRVQHLKLEALSVASVDDRGR